MYSRCTSELTISHGMNKDANQTCSEVLVCRQTRKHSQKHWLDFRNLGAVCVYVCVGVHAENLIKDVIIADNWTEVLLLMSARSASHPR